MSLKSSRYVALIVAIIGWSASIASAGVIYDNNFTGGAGSEWSNSTTAVANGESFLGDSAVGSGAGTDTLTLTGISAHSHVTVSFDFYAIRSLDGNGPAGGGSDNFSLDADGSNLLLTNFANYADEGNTQSYSALTPNGLGFSNPARSGEFAAGHLGYGDGNFGDATYRFTFTFSHTASSLALAFTSLQNQFTSDEGWGLDNVKVETDGVSPVPEPTSIALLGMGGIGLALGAIRRRQKKSIA